VTIEQCPVKPQPAKACTFLDNRDRLDQDRVNASNRVSLRHHAFARFAKPEVNRLEASFVSGQKRTMDEARVDLLRPSSQPQVRRKIMAISTEKVRQVDAN
jgi:hypothetical protein